MYELRLMLLIFLSAAVIWSHLLLLSVVSSSCRGSTVVMGSRLHGARLTAHGTVVMCLRGCDGVVTYSHGRRVLGELS